MQDVITARKFIPYFQKKYKMSFHKANIIFTLYEMLCECYPDTELTQNIEDALIKAANEILEHENSPSIEAVLQEEIMGLPNTRHLIDSNPLTVFCLQENDKVLMDKLLWELHYKGTISMPFPSTKTMEDFVEEYFKSSLNSLTVVGLNNDIASDEYNLEFHKWTVYALNVNWLIERVREHYAHTRIIATLLLKRSTEWRHVYFKIAEEYKDKVCFVRFVANADKSNIRLQIESGENSGQYIPYRLDDKGELKEV